MELLNCVYIGLFITKSVEDSPSVSLCLDLDMGQPDLQEYRRDSQHLQKFKLGSSNRPCVIRKV